MSKRIDYDGFHYLIWSESGRLNVAVRSLRESEIPEILIIDGRVYRHYDGWRRGNMFFWGGFVDEEGGLVGFDVHVIDDVLIARSPLGMQTPGAFPGSGSLGCLELRLCDVESEDYEVLESFPVDFFRYGYDDILVCLYAHRDEERIVAFEYRDLG